MPDKTPNQLSDPCFEEVLRRMVNTPPKKHEDEPLRRKRKAEKPKTTEPPK